MPGPRRVPASCSRRSDEPAALTRSDAGSESQARRARRGDLHSLWRSGDLHPACFARTRVDTGIERRRSLWRLQAACRAAPLFPGPSPPGPRLALRGGRSFAKHRRSTCFVKHRRSTCFVKHRRSIGTCSPHSGHTSLIQRDSPVPARAL